MLVKYVVVVGEEGEDGAQLLLLEVHGKLQQNPDRTKSIPTGLDGSKPGLTAAKHSTYNQDVEDVEDLEHEVSHDEDCASLTAVLEHSQVLAVVLELLQWILNHLSPEMLLKPFT